MQIKFFTFIFMLTSISIPAIGDESLAHCSAQKTQQMELTRKMRSGSTSAKTAHRKKGKSSRLSSPRQRIEDIDEWLWKNCRSYSEEMRTIEQQYM